MRTPSRRNILVGGSALAAGVATYGVADRWLGAPGPEPGKTGGRASGPNIILLLADDMRWDAMGAAGNRIIATPELDRLAATGTVFANNFVTTSICPTSRASILLGQYARRHGIWDFRTGLSVAQHATSLPGLLRQAGYRTGFVGKWGLGGSLPRGLYDVWNGFPGQGRYVGRGPDPKLHLTDHIATGASAFLKQAQATEQPFFLQVSFKAPHGQDGAEDEFRFADRFADLYRAVDIPRPPSATAASYDQLPQCLKESEGRRRWKKRFATEAMFQRTVKNYYRLITGLDAAVGKILGGLSAATRKNTLVVFTSDNGFFLGEHGLAGKWWMYEESIRTPLIVSAPGDLKASRSNGLTLNIDIAPTLLDFAGVSTPARAQGQSLRPLLAGQRQSVRDAFYYEHAFSHPTIAKCEGVRSRTWKLIEFTCGDEITRLFNLTNDPHEQRNLAADPAARPVLARLRGQLRELRKQAA